MNKMLKITFFPSLVFVMIMFCFLCVGCGEKPATPQKEIGTLNDLATCETDVEYSYADVATYFGGNLQKFVNADGFRFTYNSFVEENEQIVTYSINGIINSEGMILQSYSSEEDSDVKIVCQKNGNIYTQTTSHGEQEITQTFKYRVAGEENALKTCLQSININANLISPQALFNLIDAEKDCLIVQKGAVIRLVNSDGLSMIATLYINLDESGNVSAIKCAIPGKAQITLSAFDGLIEFPDFEQYTLEE